MVWNMKYPFGQFRSTITTVSPPCSPGGVKGRKATRGRKPCSWAAKKVVWYQHSLSHRCKAQQHEDCQGRVNSTPARTVQFQLLIPQHSYHVWSEISKYALCHIHCFISMPYSNLFIPSIYPSWNCFSPTLTTYTMYLTHRYIQQSGLHILYNYYTLSLDIYTDNIPLFHALPPPNFHKNSQLLWPNLSRGSLRTASHWIVKQQDHLGWVSTALTRFLVRPILCWFRWFLLYSFLYHTTQVMDSFLPGVNLLEVDSRFPLSPAPSAPGFLSKDNPTNALAFSQGRETHTASPSAPRV